MSDKRFYNVALNLTATLQMPIIDGPMVAFSFSTIMSNDKEDALKTEDRRAKLMLRKAYQVVAWEVS